MTVSVSHSSLADFNKCKRYYKLRHMDLLFPKIKKSALRFGGIFHASVERMYKTGELQSSLSHIEEEISKVDTTFFGQKDHSDLEWSKTVLVAASKAWFSRFYLSDLEKGVEVIQLERKYRGLPIYNPSSGYKSIKATLSFISDMVVRRPDGLYLVEYKTAAKIGDDYIAELDIDHQVSTYIFYLEMKLKEKIQGILYRVLKKPGIRLRKKETPDQFLQRLESKFEGESKDYLIEYPLFRSRGEIKEFTKDLWDETQYLLSALRTKRWPRNTQSCVMYGRCEYFPLCKRQSGAEMMYTKGEKR